VQSSPTTKPEFVRFPKNGERDPHTGLTRAFLYEAAQDGRIKTISLKARGAKRGVSLIVFDSLMDYIRGQAT
jgi:hypothetical protein